MKQRKSRKKLQNSSRRQRWTPELVDRISALPDSVLTTILSSLPTKNAVATSILSKQWKFLWTKVLNLDLCDKQHGNEQQDDEDKAMKFVGFVNHVLLLHDARVQLHKFRLVWKPCCIPSQVYSWISTAITRIVSQLCLSLHRQERMGGPFEIPTSIFSTCNTLQSLELKGIMWVPDSIAVCLPRLETLKLACVYFKSEEALLKIIRGCPILNYLRLRMVLDIHQQNFKYIVSSTTLRHLELDVDCWSEPFPCRLELEASSLECLKINGLISQIIVQGCLSFLVEANFNIFYNELNADNYDSLVEVVRSFDCAKSLTLSTHVMWALSHATISLSTTFSRLTKLEARADCCYCISLLDFIQSSDNLQFLKIYQDTFEQYLSESDHVDVDYYDQSNWTTPVEVPRCLSNNLKVVVFDGYFGSDNEREMIGYMLKHGNALEVMKISSYWSFSKDEKFELVQEICKFPRKSPACEVEFF